jgi:hypothetical protein
MRRPLHGRRLGIYASAYGSFLVFGKEDGFFSRFGGLDRATWHAGISTGVALQGTAHLRFGLAYEYMEDTSISPDPESSHLVSFGFTLVDSRTIW